MTKINTNTQFYRDMTDPNSVIKVNNGAMPLGYYNLIVSIRDCGLYAVGIKPHRNWKITDVKRYFGLTGNARSLKVQLEEIRDMFKGE